MLSTESSLSFKLSFKFIKKNIENGNIIVSIAIQWISVDKSNHAICWIVIYPGGYM